ncbi:protein angel homolog 2 isoform X1 [Osmerus mordax]|uniref:protein angel homolog 2 isoform X1 n=2 Tax=Osmerus mordax TaxID=8014 RepID=UPI00350F287F
MSLSSRSRLMFLRRLTSFGYNWSPPSPAFNDGWRTLHFTRTLCLPGGPPRPVPLNLRQHLSGAFRLLHPHSWTCNPEKGLTFLALPQRSLHLSSGLMERSNKEPPHKPPPHKRRRSTEDHGSRDSSEPRLPKTENSRHTRSSTTSPNYWFKNGANREPPPQNTSAGPQMPTKLTAPLYRGWEEFSSFYEPQQSSNQQRCEFSVLTYNILSQDLLQDNAYLYRHCTDSVLSWAFRLPNLLRELQLYDADILCLQEVQHNHYEEQIRPALQARGYWCEYKRRTGGKPDGCAVAFKRDSFSLLSRHAVEYLRPGVSLLDRDNVGLILLLRPAGGTDQSQPSSCLCVANTHLLYNPRRGDIKLAQTALLLAEIGRLAHLPDGTPCPVVLCGDLNSVPWSPLYSFLRQGCLEYEGLPTAWVSGQEENPRGQRVLSAPIWPPSLGINRQCQYQTQSSPDPAAVGQPPPPAFPPSIEHSLLLSSAYSHLVHDGRPEITTSHSRTSITVDYILYTPGAGDVAAHTEHSKAAPLPDGRGLHLLGRLGLVGQSELMKVKGLPNEHHSSDHLPLLARFCLCP